MPHEMFFVKNKNREERRNINLIHRQRHQVLRALRKLKNAQIQLALEERRILIAVTTAPKVKPAIPIKQRLAG